MSAGLKNKGYLDPRTCWKLWHVEEHSLRGVQRRFQRDGVTNPKTDQSPTKSGIEKAAFMWAIHNQAEAKKDLEYAWAREGEVLDDERWTEFLVNASRLAFFHRPGRLEKFLRENGLEDYI